jgi:hypothetical protein
VAGQPLLSEALAGFLESGLSINVATRDRECQPDGALAWAVRVHDDRLHLTVFLYEKSAPAMLRNLSTHPEIALAFDQPTSHRACQIKGRFVSTRRGKRTERAEIQRQVDGFFTELEAIGIPRAMVAGRKIWPCVAIELRVTQLFEQTPGPGAGEPLG